MTRESESSNEQPQRNTEIDDSILADARSDTAPALIRESVGNVMASALSSRRSAGTSSVKVSTKNSFDGDAAKFPLWRIKQLAIFRCSGVAAILKDAVPDEGSDDSLGSSKRTTARSAHHQLTASEHVTGAGEQREG